MKQAKQTREQIRKQWDEAAKAQQEASTTAGQIMAEWKKTSFCELLEMEKDERPRKRYEQAAQNSEYFSKVVAILRNNYKLALATETLPALLAILSRYNGKQAGERTREKMREDFKAQTGCNLYIGRSYAGCKIAIYEQGGESIEITAYKDGAPIDENNTIRATETEKLFIYLNDYIDNPAEAIKKMDELKKRAEALREEYRATVTAFNDLAVDGIRQLDY